MRRFTPIRFLGTIVLALGTHLLAAQSSVLSSGAWYKVAVEKNGVYKISYDQFRKMGFNTSADPRKIKIYGNEGGMLPQPNSTARPTDLVENAIFIEGESDGVFNSGDYILFYAQGPDLVRYDKTREIFKYESNLYSEKNFYFITVGTDNGKRLSVSENTAGSFPVIREFNDYTYHELEETNVMQSGREWFGERFDVTPEQTFTVSIPGITQNSTIRMATDVMGQSEEPSSFHVFINNVPIGTLSLTAVSGAEYGEEGIHKRDTFDIDASTALASTTTNQEIKYQYAKNGSGGAFLDFFLLSFQRELALYESQTIFRSSESVANPVSSFEIDGTTGTSLLWDITNPYDVKLQTCTHNGSKITFSTSTDVLKEFIVFSTDALSPELVGKVSNQNLHGLNTPNLVIITHPAFLTEAQRLASHRESHSQWTTVVVTPEEVYNEFSSGRQDVSAFRDFARYLYTKNPSSLKALLLMGKGSYDYKDRVQNNTNFVPTYESRNSLLPLQSYSSDDYYGFLETNEGFWGEGSSGQNHTLDIGVGRLPVKTVDEAKAIVDKIVVYDTNKKNQGRWRKNIVFVADDGNLVNNFERYHQDESNKLANAIETLHPGFDTKKIFLGTYTKTVRPNGESIPEASNDILNAFDRGSIIINYMGHGSPKVWADERVLTDLDIVELENKLYPFLITASCAFGRQDDPARISSAELSMIRPNGGAIGLVTTGRDVYSSSNVELNQAFYEALFEQESNRYYNIGEVFRHTKNNSVIGVGNRNFSLLGDPSLTLAMPSQKVLVTELKTSTGSDTLKALSTVIVKGEIQDGDDVVLEDFNGTLEATLYDKQTDFVTIGKNNPPFKFKSWHNILFQGKATVENGHFEFSFVITKNMAYEIAPGKLSLYAADPDHQLDAAGATSSFKLGGSEKNPAADNTSPTIKLYMGDVSFTNGGIVSPNTTLLARLEDASGINISNYGIGNNLIAILDNDASVFLLNDFYQSDADDFTKGWVNFPLKDLTPGKHTLTVKAWDTYNNPAQATIDFVVSDGEDLVIETFSNYPNPFKNETTLFFTHNRSGDDLEAQLLIYDMTGRQLRSYSFTVLTSPYQVDLLELNGLNDFTKNLPGGLYWARIAVRSLTNGSKNERVTKLIAVN